jgi:hypothetical protein
MKKVLVHLSMLCLLAALVIPMTGCKKDDEGMAVDTPAATEPVMTEPMATEPMSTEPMGTEPMGTEPMGTETTPPAQ